MAYGTDIDTNLSPDHRWDFDGDSLDQVGSANGTDTSMVYTSSGICKDVTNCAETNATTDRVSIPTTTDINNSAQTRKAVGGWFMPTAIQNPPKNVYGEGDATQAFRFILGWGNYLMFEVDAATSIINQIFADVPLDPDRAYHIIGLFEGNGYSNEVKFFLDGIEQLNANPTDREPDVASIPIRGVAEFGDPAGTVAVGGTAVILIAPINGKWNEWCTWDGAGAIISGSGIRVELFEKGALGDVVISSGTESVMQTALDAYADTVRGNAACCIEIQAVTGDGDIELDLDNITFNSLASIHIKYLGTGTLTLVNTNGANALQAKCSAPWGTVEVHNPATLTISGILDGSEVRIYDDNGVDVNDFGDELSGTETLSGTSYDYDHPGTSNDIVIQVLKIGYKEVILRRTLSSVDQTIVISQEYDAEGDEYGLNLFSSGNGLYTSTVESWTAQTGNTVAWDSDGGAGAVKITRNTGGDHHGGILSLSTSYDLATNFVVGKKYLAEVWLRTDSVSCYFTLGGCISPQQNSPELKATTHGSYTRISFEFTATSTTGYMQQYSMDIDDNLWIDKIQIREIYK